MIKQYELKIDTIKKLKQRVTIAKSEGRDIREMMWEVKEAIANANGYAQACQHINKNERKYDVALKLGQECEAVVELAKTT